MTKEEAIKLMTEIVRGGKMYQKSIDELNENSIGGAYSMANVLISVLKSEKIIKVKKLPEAVTSIFGAILIAYEAGLQASIDVKKEFEK